jgi:hypothetical protein
LSGGMILILKFVDRHGSDENVQMLTQPNFMVVKKFRSMQVDLGATDF